MLVLYIICAIIIAVILLLLLPIKIKVLFDRNFDYTVTFGPIRLISSKKNKDDSEENIKKTGNEGFLKKLYKEKGFSGTVAELFSYLKIIFSELGYILKKIKVRNFVCCVTVSGDDAAETAVTYGAVSAAVYGFSAFLDNTVDLKIKKLLVDADYSANNGSFELGFTVKIRLLYFVAAVIKLINKFLKYKREV